ncbi:MAG: FkbM family methyltransferase [Nitrospira sp.]|nr:FkbM family methyltransferase [Nitrospira sp.]
MRTGLYVRAAYRAFLSPAKPQASYSQYGEDLLIKLALPEPKAKGFYVDVGCHHPRRGSNTYGLYRKGWRGLLIDVEEVKVLACRLRRRRDKAVVAAVSDQEQEVSIYSPGEFSTNTTITLSSVSSPHGYRPIGRLHTTTLTNLLDKYQAPRDFALLSVDVEGADHEVIKGLDFDRYTPRVICVENWESARGIEAVLASATHRLLVDKRYRLTGWAGLSTIYKRTEETGEPGSSSR